MSMIADNAPESEVAPFVPQVFVDQCPVLPDGRPQHFYAKQDGVWVCSQCKEPRP